MQFPLMRSRSAGCLAISFVCPRDQESENMESLSVSEVQELSERLGHHFYEHVQRLAKGWGCHVLLNKSTSPYRTRGVMTINGEDWVGLHKKIWPVLSTSAHPSRCFHPTGGFTRLCSQGVNKGVSPTPGLQLSCLWSRHKDTKTSCLYIQGQPLWDVHGLCYPCAIASNGYENSWALPSLMMA